MGENSAIEWCDHSFNGWIGCTKVSPACDHCYAEVYGRRFGVEWGKGATRRLTSEANWKKPLAWNRRAAREGRRYRVFANSLSDVFDSEVDDSWRLRLFLTITATESLDWLILTKRPKVAKAYLKDGPSLSNLWLGTTIENRKLGKQRAWELAQIPAARRFWSIEPLLEDLGDLTQLGLYDTIDGERHVVDWVIVGGESGPTARPMHPDWVRSIRDQCRAAGVPFFFKQWGEWAPIYDRDVDDPDWRRCDVVARRSPQGRWINLEGGHGFHGGRVHRIDRLGKKAAGRRLDGVEHAEVPA